jgi:hypothetical protein
VRPGSDDLGALRRLPGAPVGAPASGRRPPLQSCARSRPGACRRGRAAARGYEPRRPCSVTWRGGRRCRPPSRRACPAAGARGDCPAATRHPALRAILRPPVRPSLAGGQAGACPAPQAVPAACGRRSCRSRRAHCCTRGRTHCCTQGHAHRCAGRTRAAGRTGARRLPLPVGVPEGAPAASHSPRRPRGAPSAQGNPWLPAQERNPPASPPRMRRAPVGPAPQGEQGCPCTHARRVHGSNVGTDPSGVCRMPWCLPDCCAAPPGGGGAVHPRGCPPSTPTRGGGRPGPAVLPASRAATAPSAASGWPGPAWPSQTAS